MFFRCNIDRLWWRRTARKFDAILKRPDCSRARSLLRHRRHDFRFTTARRLRTSADSRRGFFSRHAAARGGEGKRHDARPLQWIEADALRLPFPDGHFNLVTSAFGFRNLADYDAGLREIARVLAPGGECGILDFGEPGGLIGTAIASISRKFFPQSGRCFRECEAHTHICRPRSSAFRRRMKCSGVCIRLDFVRFPGRRIRLGLLDCTGE